MLIKGQDVANIKPGNTFSDDGHPHKKFDYMLSNPPFGVEWKKVEKDMRKEHESQGYNGRFGPGLPRVSDGSLLFLLHLISKMRRPVRRQPFRYCSNGSPLFTGAAGSGESEIRRYVLENDLVEAIIGLPTDMFYNTGISTYVWILSNRKPEHRKGKVQLIDALLLAKMQKQGANGRAERNTSGSPNCSATVRKMAALSHIFKTRILVIAITVERPERNGRQDRKARRKLKAGLGRQPARHRERAAQRGRGSVFQT
jgi:type I restriction enzyme M protein